MHVPARLAVRVESSLGAEVSGVAAVHLEAMRSTVTLSNVAGSITGTQQDGDFGVTGACSVKIRLLRSKAKITKVTGGLALDLRDADTDITESAGAIEVDEVRSDLSISGHKGGITVRGNDGSITIQRPTAETRVDVRRAEVEVLVERAVPMTIITSDESLRLILTGTPSFLLDAAASDAAIQATEFDLKPEVAEADARLTHQFGAKNDIRITLRNTRGDVVLRKKS
jgi:hypothetical protein